ncbi:MAG: hypothetical protein U0232_02620 [Thermomicrobiales bacterium]
MDVRQTNIPDFDLMQESQQRIANLLEDSLLHTHPLTSVDVNFMLPILSVSIAAGKLPPGDGQF